MEKYKKVIKNSKFKISPPTWNEEFELPDGLHSVSDYFKYIFIEDNPSIMTYVNKIENMIMFKIRTGSYTELLMPETIKLLRSTNSKITKDKNDENVLHVEIAEVVLIHCNIVNNNYQQNSRVFRHLVLVNHLVNYQIFCHNILYI